MIQFASEWISVGVLAAIAVWWWHVYLPARRAHEVELEQRENERRAERLNWYREQARASVAMLQVGVDFAEVVSGAGPKNLSSARADGYTPPPPPRPQAARDPCPWCSAFELAPSGRTCANCGAQRTKEPGGVIRSSGGDRPTLNPGSRLEPGQIHRLPPAVSIEFQPR